MRVLVEILGRSAYVVVLGFLLMICAPFSVVLAESTFGALPVVFLAAGFFLVVGGATLAEIRGSRAACTRKPDM